MPAGDYGAIAPTMTLKGLETLLEVIFVDFVHVHIEALIRKTLALALNGDRSMINDAGVKRADGAAAGAMEEMVLPHGKGADMSGEKLQKEMKEVELEEMQIALEERKVALKKRKLELENAKGSKAKA